MTHLRGVKPTIVPDRAPITKTPAAPKWFGAFAKQEWKRIMPPLVERRILTEADMGSVENYCVTTGRIREIEQQIAAAGEIDPKLFRMQDQAIKTARQLAAELGLTPVSRSRPAVRKNDEGDDNPFDI
jgi:P27 family predicted phage terminase small subunit